MSPVEQRAKVGSCLIVRHSRLSAFRSTGCRRKAGEIFLSTLMQNSSKGPKMDTRSQAAFLPTLLFLLLLLPTPPRWSRADCPDGCQCFAVERVLCADQRAASPPANLSREAREVVVMTSALQYLYPGALEGSPHLTRLIFLNNALRSIHSQAFRNLRQLRQLEISGNPELDHLFPSTFSQQGNLSHLQLNHNQFRTLLPGTFGPLERLESLQLKANLLSHLPPSLFGSLGNLGLLDLSLNKIQRLDAQTFAGLSQLRVLKLGNNHVGNISAEAFRHVARLTELHLEGNAISHLPDRVFAPLPRLEVLNLRGNLLSALGDQALGPEASNLTLLDLRGNRLAWLSPRSLSAATSLSELLLSSNGLAALPGELFRKLGALECLDLSENRLASLPEGIFWGLRGLTVIHLQKNQLSALDVGLFRDQETIQQLYLSDNRLPNLPAGLLERSAPPPPSSPSPPPSSPTMLRLHGNPWECDCRARYLHGLLLGERRAVETPDRVLCQSPRHLSKHPLASVPVEDLVCDDDGGEPGRCLLLRSAGELVVRCQLEKCSPPAVRLQLLEDDGAVREHLWRRDASGCVNATPTSAPAP
ncbi:uncharacterized protein LOC144086092 [Stigmatopora argus]